MSSGRRIAVIGGGAAGFFGAIRCAEAAPATAVTVFEASAQPLAKVRISGGGRCNVTHACFEPREFVAHYPRGARELLGPLHRFGPRETVAWFEQRGVVLKTEADGRMFPVTDDSATIVDCLRDAAVAAGVPVRLGCGVRTIARAAEGGFALKLSEGATVVAERVLLATGGNPASAGFAIARALGHTIEPPVPSLFTLHCDDERLRGLAGVSVPQVGASIADTNLCASGPLLVTHWGVSGPAVLRLSAWGARELHAAGYRATLVLDWTAPRAAAEIERALAALRADHPRRTVAAGNPFALPMRLWERLVQAAGIAPGVVWSQLPKTAARELVGQLTAGRYEVRGKSPNKEEFVTCGGVRLSEVDFRTMESRVCSGLFFGGEVLDIDGLTGGFNFQSAWTTGWLAGGALAGA